MSSTSGLNVNKKRKAINIFEILSDYEALSEEEILDKESKGNRNKIPPVIAYSNISYEIIKNINSKTQNEVSIKYRGNRSNIYTQNRSDYNVVLKYVK